MKKMFKALVSIFAVTAVMGCLAGCGDVTEIKEDKFKSILEKEIGNVPDVSVVQFDYSDNGETVKNLRLSNGTGLKYKMTGELDREKYINNSLGKRNIAYYGAYVLSDNETTANDMRESYKRSLANLNWKLVDPADYVTTGVFDGDLYIYENHAIFVDDVIGPVYWDVAEDSGEILYGMYVWYY